MKYAIIAIAFVVAITSVSGCALSPLPIKESLSFGHTLLDLRLFEDTGKTTSEHLASRLTGKNSKCARIESVCLTKEEEIDYIMSKNCELITWNWLGLPRCKE